MEEDMDGTTIYLGTEEGVVIYRDQEDERPREIGRGLDGHTVTALALWPGDDRTILAGTTEGIFYSEDGGQTWRQGNGGLTIGHIRSLAAHPATPGLAYAGTEPAAVFRTASGGARWEELRAVRELPGAHGWYLPYSPEAGCVRSFALAGDRIWAAVEVGGVIRSDDGGRTWRIFGNGVHEDVHWVAVHPNDADVLFAATGGGLYRTRDGGQTWDTLWDDYTRAVWIDPDDPRTVLAGPALGIGRKGRIMGSVDGGETWGLLSDGLDAPMVDMVERFAFSPARPEDVFAVTSRGEVLRAERGIWTWKRLWPEHSVNALLVR
jgi:photosystem II stability/assembly factor-like uncharacterized protein